MVIVATSISLGIPIVRPTLDSSVSMSYRRAKRQNISFETDRHPSRLRICIWTEIEIEGGFDLIFDWRGAGTCFFERFLISIKSVSISNHDLTPTAQFNPSPTIRCFFASLSASLFSFWSWKDRQANNYPASRGYIFVVLDGVRKVASADNRSNPSRNLDE